MTPSEIIGEIKKDLQKTKSGATDTDAILVYLDQMYQKPKICLHEVTHQDDKPVSFYHDICDNCGIIVNKK